MNKDRRKELEKALSLIEDAKGIVECVKDEEQDRFDNLTEGLQAAERGQKMEENCQTLEDAIGQLEEAIDNINTASE